MQFIIDRLKEPSTYVGITAFVSALGLYTFSPEQTAAIATFGVAALGVYLSFKKG